jgi:hypothetical protein
MSFSQVVFEFLGSLVFSLTPTPWDARCPNCYGDLRWISFWRKEKRIRSVDCHRQWVKGSQGRWRIDVPQNPS